MRRPKKNHFTAANKKSSGCGRKPVPLLVERKLDDRQKKKSIVSKGEGQLDDGTEKERTVATANLV